MARTLPDQIRVPGHDQPVRFPAGMQDEEIMAALKHLTPSAAVRPPIGPMTAEQAAAPTMTAGSNTDITDRGRWLQ